MLAIRAVHPMTILNYVPVIIGCINTSFLPMAAKRPSPLHGQYPGASLTQILQQPRRSFDVRERKVTGSSGRGRVFSILDI